MEPIEEMLNNLKKKMISQQEPELNLSKCKICNDDGMIYINSDSGYLQAKRCQCKIMEDAKNRMNNSGLGNLLESKTLDNYIVSSEFQKHIKDKATEYIKGFKENRYSFSILGQSGIGKTHVLSAISKQLLEQGVQVKYYVADEIIQTLQACKFDEVNYNLEFGKIVSAEVLFIDDLFKSSITNFYKEENIKGEDLREIFQVLNYRANRELPILLNSEIHFERFVDIDQAVIGRINELCNYEYLISIKPDRNKNYRLTKRK